MQFIKNTKKTLTHLLYIQLRREEKVKEKERKLNMIKIQFI